MAALTTATTSHVWRVSAGQVTEEVLDPSRLGLARASAEDLRGGDTDHNAAVVRRLLAGETGPVRDAVVLNAGAALAVYDAATGDLHDAVADGMRRASAAIDDGSAARVLARWVELSASA